MSNRDYMHGAVFGRQRIPRVRSGRRIAVTKAMMVGLAGDAPRSLALMPPNDPRLVRPKLAHDAARTTCSESFQVWRLFTYALLHGDSHAPGCSTSWDSGSSAAPSKSGWGKKRFWVFCVFACLISAIVYIAFETALRRQHADDRRERHRHGVHRAGRFLDAGAPGHLHDLPGQALGARGGARPHRRVRSAGRAQRRRGRRPSRRGVVRLSLLPLHSGHVDRLFDKIDDADERRRTKKAEKTAREQRELRRELDRILDKVNREGMPSLTSAERKFLKDASNKLR